VENRGFARGVRQRRHVSTFVGHSGSRVLDGGDTITRSDLMFEGAWGVGSPLTGFPIPHNSEVNPSPTSPFDHETMIRIAISQIAWTLVPGGGQGGLFP